MNRTQHKETLGFLYKFDPKNKHKFIEFNESDKSMMHELESMKSSTRVFPLLYNVDNKVLGREGQTKFRSREHNRLHVQTPLEVCLPDSPDL